MIEASTNVMRQRILISLALAILGFYALLSVHRARAAAERLQLARQEQMEMQRLLDGIQQLSLAPRIAADDARIRSPEFRFVTLPPLTTCHPASNWNSAICQWKWTTFASEYHRSSRPQGECLTGPFPFRIDS